MVVPRPRSSTPVVPTGGTAGIRHGVEVLDLLDVAEPSPGLRPTSLVIGFAVGAMVAARRRVR